MNTKPQNWPFDRFLLPDEQVLWQAKAGRPYWGKFIRSVIVIVPSLPLIFMFWIWLPSITSWPYNLYVILQLIFWAIPVMFFPLLLWQLGRCFYFYFALTDHRVLIVNTFLFRTVRSVPARWILPDLVWGHDFSHKGNVHVPCSCESGLPKDLVHETFVMKHLLSGFRTCWYCYWGPGTMVGINEPVRIANLIKSTLGPKQAAEAAAFRREHLFD